MDNISQSDNQIEPASTPRPRPLVLLFLAGWGIAPEGDGNAISSSRTPTFSGLVKDYPVALLDPGEKTLNARYLSLGTGQDIDETSAAQIPALNEIIAQHNLKQIKIGETERFAVRYVLYYMPARDGTSRRGVRFGRRLGSAARFFRRRRRRR